MRGGPLVPIAKPYATSPGEDASRQGGGDRSRVAGTGAGATFFRSGDNPHLRGRAAEHDIKSPPAPVDNSNDPRHNETPRATRRETVEHLINTVDREARLKIIKDFAVALEVPQRRRNAFEKMILGFLEAGAALLGRGKPARRLKWETDQRPGEDPAHFAWRAYAAEAKAGKLHRGLIYDEDRALYTKLNSWLRSNAMPDGIDIPTKRDWITRQIEAGRAKPAPRVPTEEGRLYNVEKTRRWRTRRSSLTMW
jgi:hypothetical protein